MGQGADQAEAERLMDLAYDYLDAENPEEALRVADMLEELGYSGAFEIRALALMDLDRLDDAIAALERGVEIAPAWMLFQLLGSYYSEAERYDDALKAYDQAAAIEHDPVSVAYNRAQVLWRMERFDECEAVLRPLVETRAWADNDPRLGQFIVGQYVDLLEQLGRKTEARALLKAERELMRDALG